MIKGSFYFIGRSPSSKLSLSILVAIDTLVEGMFASHVTLQDT